MRRRFRRGKERDGEMPAEEGEDIPIDMLENRRGRTARQHVADDAVGMEIERR